MKKIVLVFVMMISFVGAIAQNKSQEKKIKYFVDSATTEFKLDDAKSKELLKARNTYVTNYMEVFSKAKSGEISKDDKKEKMNEVNSAFNAEFSKITGKSGAELKPFFEKMRNELSSI
ncbi:hypothetical protein [Flavobacterium sp. 7A]|uniref:hypothetical protein n=1 Tax=Flavobacterium sp. 7A TaxID=2940571 RepID=UPI0022264477|nr:hypothetical protein [Flavobacterium sp. 7A]MCW2119010.1 putative membrane protein [Flavobacterium sp. 7A]